MVKISSSSIKLFDIVCIGPHASKVGSKVYHKLQNPLLKAFLINDDLEHFQPILMQSHFNPFIKINPKNYPCFIQSGNGIQSILPEKSQIIMKNGQRIRYKQLIYSGTHKNWKNSNYYKNLAQGLSLPHTSLYGDQYCRNIHQLYRRLKGNIIISIPKLNHFGYQNYFMMHLKDSLIKQSQKNKVRVQSKIFVVMEGDKFFPQCPDHDVLIKKMLKDLGIEFITGVNIGHLDYKKRTVIINGSKTKYQAFYQYMPLKVPDILLNAKIDPFQIDHQTLKHKQYSNISILGNVLPTTHSFYALNYQSHVIAANVAYSLLGSTKCSLYQGNSYIPLWYGKNNVMYLGMNYQGKNGFFNEMGQNKSLSNILALDRKLLSRYQIESYLNGNSLGYPYYLSSPALKTIFRDKSLLPVIINKC